MISWRGLKTWGFDAFEADRLSAVTVFQRGSSKHLLEPNEGKSSEGEEDCAERSRQGCPLVLIGRELLSSPYSRLAMAENVDDEELTERAYEAIGQRANTFI